MAINLALKTRVDLEPGSADWGRSWYGWDPLLTDKELWDQNRGTWRISRHRLEHERILTLSYDASIRIVVEISGYENVGDLLAVQGDVLLPGDRARDELIGRSVPRQRNPVCYFPTPNLDEIAVAEHSYGRRQGRGST